MYNLRVRDHNKISADLGNSWPDIQGSTADQSLLALDSKLLHAHLAISRALSLAS